MTVFFQDAEQLKYLVQTALPELIRSYGSGVRHELMLWSAGCFSGEELYTLAMVLSEFATRYPGLGFRFMILATDVAGNVLETAKRAIYHEDSVQLVPATMQKKYLLRSKDRDKRLVRVNADIRSQVKFRQIQSLEGELTFREPIDIIYCSNLAGQSGNAMWSKLLARFYRYLSPGGYIFVRDPHQPLPDVKVPLRLVAPTVYKKFEA
jgi:chemotaxis protein methyltransferase CheR